MEKVFQSRGCARGNSGRVCRASVLGGTVTLVSVLVLLPMVLGCICATNGVVAGEVIVEAGTQTGTLVLTRTDDVPAGLALDVLASQAAAESGTEPPSMRLTLEVADGVTVVGEGEGMAALNLLDVDRRLRDCEGECRFPITLVTPEGSGTFTIIAGQMSSTDHSCEDPFMTAAFEF